MATISLRVADDDLAAIDDRAGRAGMTRTAFMPKAVFGAATADEQRFEEIEDWLQRVERAAGLGAFG